MRAQGPQVERGVRMNRRRMTAAVAMAALLVLSGCGGEKQAEEAKPKTPSKKQVFLKEVKRADISSWDESGPDNSELLGYPKTWCRELNKGHSLSKLLETTGESYPVGMDWGTQIDEAAELVVIGAGVYCPKHKERVAQEARDAGYM